MKEDRQIEWKEHKSQTSGRIDFYGFYKKKKLFLISEELNLYLVGMGFLLDAFLNSYESVNGAKRGAERFLRRLQEAVK